MLLKILGMLRNLLRRRRRLLHFINQLRQPGRGVRVAGERVEREGMHGDDSCLVCQTIAGGKQMICMYLSAECICFPTHSTASVATVAELPLTQNTCCLFVVVINTIYARADVILL